ncbi:MAG: hypothetical protein COB02_12715 [Candidatus Cloacimonadota bacterium]|nr:MAG: hypothetical protein COB02_12715 [Candidatus Cloacimonadota bacterium]
MYKTKKISLQQIEASLKLKKWMAQYIGLKLKESHRLFFENKNEEEKLNREKEISYYLKVVSGIIELQKFKSCKKLLELGFEISNKLTYFQWEPNIKNKQFIDLFKDFFIEFEFDNEKQIFRMRLE